MSYKLEASSQAYGEQNFLTHTLKGETPEQDLNFFGQRIDSYGVIDFTDITPSGSNTYRPSAHGINSDLTILSIGISGFLLCLGVGTLKSHHYKVEYQQFQLEVGTALYKVKKVSDTLERTAETSAIATRS